MPFEHFLSGHLLPVASLSFVLAYLVGSVSFSIVVSRCFGLGDPRTQGSGNAGATNVLRSGHRLAAFYTLLGDLGKGTFVMLVAKHYGHAYGEWSCWILGSAMLGVFLGHLYPIFFKFQGGKGVATNIGILLGIYWVLGLLVAAIWLLVLKLRRQSSVASLAAAIVAPVLTYYYGEIAVDLTGSDYRYQQALAYGVAVLSLLQIWQHRGNIKRLMAGTEPSVKF